MSNRSHIAWWDDYFKSRRCPKREFWLLRWGGGFQSHILSYRCAIYVILYPIQCFSWLTHNENSRSFGSAWSLIQGMTSSKASSRVVVHSIPKTSCEAISGNSGSLWISPKPTAVTDKNGSDSWNQDRTSNIIQLLA